MMQLPPWRPRQHLKISALASSIDLMPTLHSFCGLKSPDTCVGRDLSGAVTGGAARAGDADDKLLSNVTGGVLLYDLEKDPCEMNNLAEEKSAGALKEDLLAQMKRWAKDTADPYPSGLTLGGKTLHRRAGCEGAGLAG